MALDSDAFHDRIQAMLVSAAGVQRVYKGHPGSWTHTVTVYSTLGGQTVDFKAVNGTLIRSARVFVEFGYRIASNPDVATCEQVLGDYLDSFIALFMADLRAGFGGVCSDGDLDLSLGDAPDYWRMGGQEIRTYPLVVTGIQKQTW